MSTAGVPLTHEGFRQRLGFALERHFEHLIDPFHRMDVEPVLNVVRYFHEILNVVLRNQHGLDPTPVSRQNFFLNSAYF